MGGPIGGPREPPKMAVFGTPRLPPCVGREIRIFAPGAPGRPGGPPGPPARPPGRGGPPGGSRGGSQGGPKGVQKGSKKTPKNGRFWASLSPKYIPKWGSKRGSKKGVFWGGPHTPVMGGPMFVPKSQKIPKIRVPCLSRMGDLLNTQRNVHFFVPRGVPGGFPEPGHSGGPRPGQGGVPP